jgi:glycosyltransferase involved in cell wall biosynthesis
MAHPKIKYCLIIVTLQASKGCHLMQQPFISICVPSYKRPHYIKRLFDSIKEQTYTNFNVFVTDNTPDNSVKDIVETYQNHFPVIYIKNETLLSMGQNWNRVFSVADGEWLKMLHDDDWFATPESLARFAKAAQSTKKRFISSWYKEITDSGKVTALHAVQADWVKAVEENPYLFFVSNKIGPPSVTMIHRTLKDNLFDERLKWLVDVDLYIRIADKAGLEVINEQLINIGKSDVQATFFYYTNPEVEIPESLMLYSKYKDKLWNNIQLYDKWWRLVRNIKEIKTTADLHHYAAGHEVPAILDSMVKIQQPIPKSVLQHGVFSKIYMSMAYLLSNKH